MNQRRIESFLLRIIVEDCPNGNGRAGEWRGRVQHVASGTEEQFDTTQDMLSFIHNQITVDESANHRTSEPTPDTDR